MKTIKEIRTRMLNHGLCWWQIAREMKISEATLYRKIREPVDSETIQAINAAIDKILSERE